MSHLYARIIARASRACALATALGPAIAFGAGSEIVAVGTDTGEKPQSKIWYHDGSYWAILDGPDGVAFYEKTGSQWDRGQFTDAVLTSSGAADVKWNGTNLYVLVYDSSPELFEYAYDAASRGWNLEPGFPVSVPDPSGSETMVLEEDSTGRLWATAEGGNKIHVSYTTSDHRSWSGTSFVARDGVGSDDISSVIAFDGNKIGVFWSDQNRDEFGFRIHHDGNSPTDWQSVEVVYPGSGHADDHVNLAFDSSGRVYAATKDDSDRFQVQRRSTNGSWTTKQDVQGGNSTRGIIMVAEEDDLVYVLYTNWDSSPDRIDYRTASLGSLSFGNTTNFISSSSSMNNVTGMKQILPAGSMIAIATKSGSSAWWNGFGDPPPGDPPAAQPPRALTANLESGPARAELAWEEPVSGPPDGYHVYRQEGGGPFVEISSALVAGTTYTDPVPPGDVLCYRATAETGGEETAPSNSDCVDNTPVLPPDPPSGVTATAVDRVSGNVVLEAWLDEGGDQLASDFSGLGNHGQLGSSATPDSQDPAWTTGVSGSALELDGVDDRVTVLDAPSLDLSTSLTIEAWVMREANAPGVILRKSTSGSGNYDVRVMSPGGVEFSWENGGGQTQIVTAAAALGLGVWHHLACVLDGDAGENRIFVDGELTAASPAAGLPATNDAPLSLGDDPALNPPFAGRIDQLRVAGASLYRETFAAPASYSAPTGILLQWEAPTGGEPPSGYNVYRSLEGAPYGILNPGPIPETEFLDPTPAGAVCYYVTALGASDLESSPSATACDSLKTVLLSPPLAPGGVTAELSEPSVQVQWSPPGGGAIVVGYHVYRGVDSQPAFRLTAVPVAGLALVDPSPPIGELCYRVRAVDNLGREGYASAEACVIRVPPPPGPPESLAAVVDSSAVPGTSGAAAFALDEGSGQILADATGNGNTGQLGPTGGVDSEDPGWTLGVTGSALLLDGGNDYALVPDAPLLAIAGGFTIEAWIQVTGADDQCVLSKGGSQERNYWIVIEADGSIDFRWETPGGSNHGSRASSALPNSDWHHVACVYDLDHGENRIYLDGELLLAEVDSGTPTTSADPLLIGARASGSGRSDRFEGSIDLVRVSSGAVYAANFTPTIAFLEGGQQVVEISWEPPLTGEASSYNLYRSLEGGPFTLLSETPIPDTTYVDADSGAVAACYQVSAIDAFGQEGTLSPIVCVTDPAPTGIVEIPGEVQGLSFHPNPVRGSGEILFDLPRSQSVSLVVYGVTGRRVATLLDGVQPSGRQQLRWNGRDPAGRPVAAGTYFLVLRAGEGVEVQKLTVLK